MIITHVRPPAQATRAPASCRRTADLQLELRHRLAIFATVLVDGESARVRNTYTPNLVVHPSKLQRVLDHACDLAALAREQDENDGFQVPGGM